MQVWTDGPRVGRTEEEWKPEFRKTLRQCVEVEKAITALLAASALSPAVQQKALEAYRTATSVLRHLPELERLPGSAATIDSGLAPFESFIPRWDSEW
jgi:succinylglutamate desuccinylase